MTFLQFTPTNGKHVATFTAGDANVLQYSITAKQTNPDLLANVNISARISSDFEWVPVKMIVNSPAMLIARIDVPAGVTVQVVADADIKAGVLIS